MVNGTVEDNIDSTKSAIREIMIGRGNRIIS